MGTFFKRRVLVLFVVGVGVLADGAKALPVYRVEFLGTLGGETGIAYGINDRGQVVGGATSTSGLFHAFLYDGGMMTDIGTLYGSPFSTARDINENGQIVGWSSDYNRRDAFLYSGGTMTDITAPGRGLGSEAMAINNGGIAVGGIDYGDHFLPFLYIGDTLTALEPFPGETGGAVDINNNGQVAVSSPIGGFLYEAGTFKSLPGLEGERCFPRAINDDGQVVGISYSHAFLYDGETSTDLGTLGGHFSDAYDINNKGQVVGLAETEDTQSRPFVFTAGTMLDLNTLLTDASADWVVTDAQAINNNGWIVGQGYNPVTGEHGAVLLIQVVPEPASVFLLGAGLAGLVLRRVRRMS